jgi:hypothetical protein
MNEIKEYYVVNGTYKDTYTFVFIIEDKSLLDSLELALLASNHQVVITEFKGYVQQAYLHTEDDINTYDFYIDYVNNLVNDSHNRCGENLWD